MKFDHDHNDPKLDPVTRKPGEEGYRPDGRRMAVPVAMLKPVCQREGCDKEATQLPIMIVRPHLDAVILNGENADYEYECPMPTTTLCSTHALELRDHPDMLITDAGWENLTKMIVSQGNSPPDRNRVSWRFEPIPDDEEVARIEAMRKEARANQLRREAVN